MGVVKISSDEFDSVEIEVIFFNVVTLDVHHSVVIGHIVLRDGSHEAIRH